MKELKLIIDNTTVERYNEHYLRVHSRAYKPAIEDPYHPQMNRWMIMPRPMMNALKQKWKDFIIWFIKTEGYTNLHIEGCDMKFVTYYKTNRRHDVDAATPKFITDGFTESGFIVDDDSKHLHSLTLECYVDKENPRTEITISNIELKENHNE